MKPINPYLGASPLRSSRIGYIDVQGKSWDSVVFQQSKSILDFDLNVMQRILQESIAQLTRSLFISGFTSNTAITTSGSNVLLPDSKVNFFGTTARIADPSGTDQRITIDCSGWTGTSVSNQVFLWLELWFQEVAPALVSEPFDGLSSLENKLSTVYQYGNDPISGGTILTNELKDTGFGAETTRRVQVRWRIRQTPGITSTTTYPKGFVNTDASASNLIVWAQGGRKSCVISGYTSGNTLTVTSVTSGYIMNGMKITGNGFTTATITASASGNQTGNYTFDGGAQSVGTSGTPVTFYGWFTIAKNFSRADKTSGNDFSKDGDTNVYIAGDGTTADALLLNTVDGRVYGLPIGFYYAGSPNGVFTDARNVVTGVNTGSLVGTGASFSGTGVGTSGLVINVGGSNPQITTSSSNTNTNLVIDPGGDGSLQVNGSILSPSIWPNNAAGAPAYSFQSYTNSGLYYDASNGVAISQNGSNVAYFSDTNGLTVNGIVTGTALRSNGTTTWGSNVASGRYLGTVTNANPASATGAAWVAGDYVLDTGGFVRVATPITATATFNSAATTITINSGTISPATGAFIVGAPITGTGIDTGTYITAVAAGGGAGSYTISKATLSQQTGVTVTSVYWILAGTNTGLPNYWTALNSFTSSSSNSTHTTAANYVENISVGTTGAILGTAANTSWNYTISSSKIDVLNVQASNTGTTLKNAVILEIPGVPTKNGTTGNLTLNNSYGLKIGSSTSNAVNAYGLFSDAPTSATNNYALYVNTGASYFAGTTKYGNNLIIAPIDTPGQPTVTKTGVSTTTNYYYKISAIDSAGNETTAGATSSVVTNAVVASLNSSTAYNTVVFSQVQNAVSYNIYRSTDNFVANIVKVATGVTATIVGDSSTVSYIDYSTSTTETTLPSGYIPKLGIGTSSPDSYNSYGNNLVVKNTTSTGITIVSGSVDYGSIHFADGTTGSDSYRGQIVYNHTTNALSFSTDASERMRINSSGNVGIGTNSPSATLHVTGTVAGAVAPRCVISPGSFIPNSVGPTMAYITTNSDKYELQYADGTDRIAYTTFSVPYNYSGGSIQIKIYWYISSGTNSQVRWEGWASSVASSGSVNSAPALVTSVNAGAASGATAATLIISTMTWSASLPAAGSLLYFGLKRVPSDGNDTSGASANVQAVAFEFGS